MYIHINIVQQPLQHIARSEEYKFQIYRIRNYIIWRLFKWPESVSLKGWGAIQILC